MSPEDGVQMATSSAARIIGLEDRGTVEVGMKADLVVSDPDHIIDRASYDDPERRSEGIELVVVNGKLAWQGGPRAHPGRVLRR